MSITAAYQAELRSLLTGAGTDYPILTADLGSAVTASADVAPSVRAGMSLAGDRARSRVLAFEFGITGTTPTEAAGRLDALLAAWRPSTVDLPLDVQTAAGTRRYLGRPRISASAVDHMVEHDSWLTFDATFVCSAPFGYGPEVADETNSGTFAIPAAGLGALGADTDQVTLVFTGNGGAPTLTSSTTGGRIALHTVAGGQEAVVRLRDGWVGVGAPGSPVYTPGLLDATSTWLALAGGVENTLVLTGAASVDVLYRPAYW